METRSIIIFIILLIVSILIYNNIQESTRIVGTNINIISNNIVEEEIKKKSTKSSIWRIGESLRLGDSKESENGLYKIKVESGKENGINMLYLTSYNPKLAKPIIITSNYDGATFTLYHDGIHSNSTTDVNVTGIRARSIYDTNKNQIIILPSLPYDTNSASQNFHIVKNIDRIKFDNSGVFGLDNHNIIIFIDLF